MQNDLNPADEQKQRLCVSIETNIITEDGYTDQASYLAPNT